jgi:hypothetical protein
VTPDGKPLFHINIFDHGDGYATCDVMAPYSSRIRGMGFEGRHAVTASKQNGRAMIEYGPDQQPGAEAESHEPLRTWGPPIAVLKDQR